MPEGCEKMSKQDVMDYVFETPYNTNPKILDQILDDLIDEAGASGGGDLISSNEMNKIKILPDKTMEVNSLSLDKLVDSPISTQVVLFGGNA